MTNYSERKANLTCPQERFFGPLFVATHSNYSAIRVVLTRKPRWTVPASCNWDRFPPNGP